ncbi:hypothetical protein MATL_G00030970 [Megalops atlanticus]|uniref:Cystatin fetuin-B-type domain-containing protein n=1 Tax=Megalops atlanticus TaxID=7932 RepID=A0A9D3TJZ7_MEGAT|nr:hypothetical protein MATL_G00030970 [Megalops atlanticus]
MSKMKKLTWLLILTQIAASLAQVIELLPLPCNDKNVEKISRLALTYINEDRAVGYKFSLNRISNVHLHAQGPAGKVYYLELDVLETKCHVRSPKSWKRCDIRPVMETQISGNCNVTTLHTSQGFSYLYSYDCTLVPDEPEKLLKICPDCPLLLPVDSAEAQQAAQLTLRKYNSQSTLPATFSVQSITRASAKRAPVQCSFVEYTIQETECPEGRLATRLCKPEDLGRAPAGFCVGAVYGNGKSNPEVEVSCEIFHPQDFEMSVPGTAVNGAGQQQVPEVLPAQHEKSAGSEAKITIPQETSDPVQQPAVPKDLTPDPDPFDPVKKATVEVSNPKPSVHVQHAPPNESSESESDSESSEELGGTFVRPPLDFRYKSPRLRRQAGTDGSPQHNPVFLSVFPALPSPFRSCPGAPRFSTV